MRRSLQSKILANLLAIAMVASGSGIYALENGNTAAATAATELTKVLGAEDIDLRVKWNDKSNVGKGREVALSDGRKITVKDNGTMRTKLNSQYLADNEMGLGINLGNTLDAVHPVENKANLSGTDYDTAWGSPVTTRAYIDLLHTYGINTLRIPVAWSNGDVDDDTYTIKGVLLDRVEEVANYALDNGMYVVINDHWDNQWWGQFGACKRDAAGNKVADEETRANAWKRYESYWTQIATRFKDYSDHLILEGANEELGDRLNDAICLNGPAKGYVKPDNATGIEAMTGNLNTKELYEMTNKINQKFVDVVRATGGNNTSRHLLIPGYNTNIDNTADSRFKMPKDTNENGTSKLFLSVHYYSPTDFALSDAEGTYTTEDQEYTKTSFANLKSFNDEGYGVIIGECGFCNPSGVTGSVTQWFYDTYKEAANYHAVPVLWDTGAFFDRTVPEINYKDIAIFYNTVNQVNGSTAVETITGGSSSTDDGSARKIPDYLDSELWNTPGIHAYLFYQTSTWDYRNPYQPLKNLSNDWHSWEYVRSGGVEVTAAKTKVVDVLITGNGTYTVSIDGIDLSAANSFKMLGISTNIQKNTYWDENNPAISVDATVEFDGNNMTETPFTMIMRKNNDIYLDFMAIDVYDSENIAAYGLGAANENGTLKMPQKSVEITFTIRGLDKPLADIASGEWVNPETGEKISATSSVAPTINPVIPTIKPNGSPTSIPTIKPSSSSTTISTMKPGNSFAVSPSPSAGASTSPTTSPTSVKRHQSITAVSYVKTYGSKAFMLNAKSSGNGSLSYGRANKKIALVSRSGKVTIKGYGKTSVTITASGTDDYYGAVKIISITVIPRKAVITKLVSRKRSLLTCKIKTQKKVTGYEFVVTAPNGVQKIIKKKKPTLTAKYLSGKKYKVKVRAYKKVGKKVYRGAWSNSKSIKTK